ncbi:amidase [Carnobacterium antarcticum]|uniref:Amidase n=1 Tax=Carnobacterium antarcticum TaxID=2126436 RepID=A0ABW4NK03_9LACT|nr:amidase [Carnobacterium sp. CP1]ALV22430.1 6-aminohexanoate-cyclic-dimer hydrolase [Carnobacterium sp. CP1]
MFNRKEDGLALAKKLHQKDVSPQELIETAFKKIEAQNPILNAVTHTRKEKALKEAAERDFSSTLFGGQPILIKGIGQDQIDEPSTSGSRLLQNNRSKQTSHFVRALEKAGFVVIGQTNTPEFAFKNITDPTLYGPSRNPWNTAYSPGGSSGGAAASVVADLVPIASASDGGGSIRIPASFTGLVGLKPTRGRTPIGPGVGRGWQGASISFALTKTIRDTAAMMDALQTVQQSAAFQTPLFERGYLNALADSEPKKFRVAYSLVSPVHGPVSDEAKAAVLKTVRWLEQNGHQVVEEKPAIDGVSLMESYYIMNSGETAAMFANIEKGLQRPVTKSDMELMTWVLFNAGQSISASTYSNSIAAWDTAAEVMADFHQTYDLYLTPATADVAPRVDAKLQTDEQFERMHHVTEMNAKDQQKIVWDMFAASLDITPFTQQANLTGQPAISLPVHLSANSGLPIGVQFTAPKGNEDWLLAIGQEMEQDGLFT